MLREGAGEFKTHGQRGDIRHHGAYRRLGFRQEEGTHLALRAAVGLQACSETGVTLKTGTERPLFP